MGEQRKNIESEFGTGQGATAPDRAVDRTPKRRYPARGGQDPAAEGVHANRTPRTPESGNRLTDTTPLLPTFQKLINDDFDQLYSKQVAPWASFAAGRVFTVRTFGGTDISYSGVEFEGSPRSTFWDRYVEPFIEDVCIREIDTAVAKAHEKNVDARKLLPEVRDLLLEGVRRTYSRMADIDEDLRSNRHAQSVERRSTEQEYAAMAAFVNEQIQCELEMLGQKPPIQRWIETRKPILWAIGIVLGALLASFRLAGLL